MNITGMSSVWICLNFDSESPLHIKHLQKKKRWTEADPSHGLCRPLARLLWWLRRSKGLDRKSLQARTKIRAKIKGSFDGLRVSDSSREIMLPLLLLACFNIVWQILHVFETLWANLCRHHKELNMKRYDKIYHRIRYCHKKLNNITIRLIHRDKSAVPIMPAVQLLLLLCFGPRSS